MCLLNNECKSKVEVSLRPHVFITFVSQVNSYPLFAIIISFDDTKMQANKACLLGSVSRRVVNCSRFVKNLIFHKKRNLIVVKGIE